MSFSVERVVPVVRIFDLARAREFYLDYLGCSLDWADNADGPGPIYLQVSRDGLVLHLSEHHGDGTPGHTIYVRAAGVRDLHQELGAKDYPYLFPGLEPSPGVDGGVSLTLIDPFGNTLRIDERPAG